MVGMTDNLQKFQLVHRLAGLKDAELAILRLLDEKRGLVSDSDINAYSAAAECIRGLQRRMQLEIDSL